uniref:Uncharacterized protein n=1 Tax=Ralstonia solanacearum TaxID=305 RepID=A0A0S4WDW7_RALSL|nr:protein of unknown function [Ralstonia solanacearum]
MPQFPLRKDFDFRLTPSIVASLQKPLGNDRALSFQEKDSTKPQLLIDVQPNLLVNPHGATQHEVAV